MLGVARRGQFTVPLNFLPTDPTHDHLTGIQAHFFTNTVSGYKVTFPVAAGSVEWVMSGQVQGIDANAPVDGKLSANLTLRFSGKMTIGGVVIG